MKTYGNLNLKEYTAEAKRQIKNKKATAKPSRVKKPTEMAADAEKNRGTGKGSGGFMTKPTKAKEGSYDAPKSQMKGSLKPSDKTTKTKTTKPKADLIVTKDAKKTMIKEIEQINVCVDDKATQIYDMSKQYEKLFNENVLLKREIAKLKQGDR